MPPRPTSTPAPIEDRQGSCDPPATTLTLTPTHPTTSHATSTVSTLVESLSQAGAASTALPKPTTMVVPELSTVPAASKAARGKKCSAPGQTSARSTKRVKT